MSLRFLLPFLLSFLAQQRTHHVNAARSLSARRVRGTQASRAADKYDRSITTFSPEGRLLQLEYALIAAEEQGRGLTVCVEVDGVVVFAFPSSDDDDNILLPTALPPSASTPYPSSNSDEEDGTNNDNNMSELNAESFPRPEFSSDTQHSPTHNAKIHRLSPSHLLLTSGLTGDSRTLASAFRRLTASWTHVNYGEVVTSHEVSKEMGRVRHGIGLRSGARVLGVMGVLIGLDDDGMAATDDNSSGTEVRMYRSLPGGTIDRCNVCCTGGGTDAAGNAARKDAMEALLRVIASSSSDDANGDSLSEKDTFLKKEKMLKKVIEEVGRIALKYHPDSEVKGERQKEAVLDDSLKKRVAVDIWAVRATPAISENESDHNYAYISPHRYLGKALMDTRYARRVALDQLSIAAQCLIYKSSTV